MLVLAPAACCLAGIAAHEVLLTLSRSVRAGLAERQAQKVVPVGTDKGGDKGSKTSFKASGKSSRKGAFTDGGKVSHLHIDNKVHAASCDEGRDPRYRRDCLI